MQAAAKKSTNPRASELQSTDGGIFLFSSNIPGRLTVSCLKTSLGRLHRSIVILRRWISCQQSDDWHNALDFHDPHSSLSSAKPASNQLSPSSSMSNASAERHPTETVKFPDLDLTTSTDYLPAHRDDADRHHITGRTPSPRFYPRPNGTVRHDRWPAKKESHIAWSNGHLSATPSKHARQKSISEAIRTIRTRKGSVSANAAELAHALKAPVSVKLIILCLIWYMSSALTNTSSKTILNAFPQPITLTVIQFACVSSWCITLACLGHLFPPLQKAIPVLRHGIRYPTRDIIRTTLPLAMFQIGGHILSSTATEKIPVSLVHTIKGLSPLFTVLAYRFIFHIHYATATYLSLIPLTLGVVLACSVEFSGNISGIICAFGGAIIFVTQNIFSKKLFNEAARVEAEGPLPLSQQQRQHQVQGAKLDKLNLLCYCSGLAFLLTFPLWLWTEGLPILSSPILLTPFPSTPAHKTTNLPLEFFFNGIFHFGQNILAFVLLSMVSPVTYSVASLIKRVFVIIVAIVWFGQKTTGVQAAGILLTFIGLYLYDRTSDAAKADRRAKLEQLRQDMPILPTYSSNAGDPPSYSNGSKFTATPLSGSGGLFGGANGFVSGEDKKYDATGPGRPREGSQTWRAFSPGRRPDELGKEYG
ncbi:MAG: hypothetical protein Q9206_002283 [Seirophora lacunosa]